MMYRIRFAFLLAAVFFAPLRAEEPSQRRQVEFFETKIRPALVTHCYSCHSAEAEKVGKLKGGLALDTRAGLLQGGDSGPALAPGMPAESLLLSAVRYEDYEMPPAGQLPEAVIADFEKWIADGAVDPRGGDAVRTQPTYDFKRARQFWSLRPIVRPGVPAVQATAWPRSDIDRFVLARMEHEGLGPVEDADARALVRRLHFDLLGLPPTPERVDRFLHESEQDRRAAIEELVDELLASPHFGERWGRHWLDVVRYAESNGRDVNVVWYDAWRYRDWIIDALNSDLPFDRFVQEQVAGDLLPADTPEQRDQQQIATGLLAMAPRMIGEPNKDLLQMDTIDDQIDLLGRAFLGLSISCARCHDHKFDPIPTSDYYAVAGILKSTETLYGFARIGAQGSLHSDLIPIGTKASSLGESGLEYRRQVIDRNREFQQARADRYRIVRRVADAKIQLDKPDADVEALRAQIERMEAEIAEWDEEIKRLEELLNSFLANPPAQPDWAMGVRDLDQPVDCRIHIRGETGHLGEAVSRGVLQVIALHDVSPIPGSSSGRRQLAEWLADDRNPLTPRVAVNRVWTHLLGRGLVASVDDFGTTGSPPSHPELLDYLARAFVDDGWSIKRIIRLIVLSRTYQLASHDAKALDDAESPMARGMAIDPDNIFLWRFRPRRLEAEIFRDAVMAVSGQLDRSPPAAPFLSRWNRYEHHSIKSFQPFVTPESLEHRHRSVYLPVLRGSLPEVFELFDFADPNQGVGQREESTVPAQALFLMNSDWITQRASWAADRLLTESCQNDSDRVARLFLLALGRPPSDQELAESLSYLARKEGSNQQPDASESHDLSRARHARWTSYCQIIFGSAEFRYVP